MYFMLTIARKWAIFYMYILTIKHKGADIMKNKKINCKVCGAEMAKSAKNCPSCGVKNKKPVFARWWFWVLSALIIIGVIGGSSNKSANTNDKPASQVNISTTSNSSSEKPSTITPTKEVTPTKAPEPTSAPEPDIWIKGGTYKVGADIDAGEYLVVATGRNCYIEVDKDSKGTFDSIISNENTSTRVYFTLLDGQYFKVQGGIFAKAEDVAPFEPENSIYEQGMYLVGKDIPAGEYKITANDAFCYIEIDKDSYNIFNSIISNENLSLGESTYITISEGQYIKFRGGQIILP